MCNGLHGIYIEIAPQDSSSASAACGDEPRTLWPPLVWTVLFVDMCVIQRYLALSGAIWRYLAQSRAISRNLGRFKVKKIFFACGGRLICVRNCLIPRAELNQAASPGVELGARS